MPDYIGTSGNDQIVANAPGLLQGLDGDDVLIANAFGNFTLDGGAGNDRLLGGGGQESMSGGPGNDYFDAGNIISGGSGADVFNWAAGLANAGLTNPPTILDWEAVDRILFANGQLPDTSYAETTAATPEAAALAARDIIGPGVARIVTVQVGADLYVFAKTTGNSRSYYDSAGVLRASYDDAIKLTGRTLADISAANFSAATTPATYEGTAASERINGDRGPGTISGLGGDDVLVALSAGDFTLNGGSGDDQLFGGNGRDALDGGDGNDVLEGGPGQDTLSGGAGADVFSWAAGVPGGGVQDLITDWSREDRLSFGSGGVLGAGYLEATAADYTAAKALADNAIAGGSVNFVSVAVGGDVYVFADSQNNNGQADDIARLRGRSLGDIDATNFFSSQAGPTLPAAPSVTTTGRVQILGDMDRIHPRDIIGTVITRADETGLILQSAWVNVAVAGTGFTYSNNQLVAGVANALGFSVTSGGLPVVTFNVSQVSFPAVSLAAWAATDDNVGALSTMLAGADDISGSLQSLAPGPLTGADLIRGYGGNDVIRGAGGADTIFGGAGDDVIYANGGNSATTGGAYLRGDEGSDYIIGALGFDDINGNMGNDTASGGDGDDWVVGGKDNDLLFGDAGGDLVYGNLGSDTCVGGSGDDTVRGGQDNDLIHGDAGADYLSGDKGDDTVVGGTGADLFHTFGDAGIDRVLDFNASQGDRVLLDPGTQYTIAQVGADTVISMTGGGQMILVGVQMGSLPTGWIFGA
ncbi:MAG: hypothetical protein DI570_08360 [Phenylobacterium zucineum]|nr:MAG: hypothetical protein DI570_08360 [Phenylobacterium zucineum]